MDRDNVFRHKSNDKRCVMTYSYLKVYFHTRGLKMAAKNLKVQQMKANTLNLTPTLKFQFLTVL